MNWRAWASAFWQTVSPASHDEPWPTHAITSRRSSSDGYQRAIAASAATGAVGHLNPPWRPWSLPGTSFGDARHRAGRVSRWANTRRPAAGLVPTYLPILSAAEPTHHGPTSTTRVGLGLPASLLRLRRPPAHRIHTDRLRSRAPVDGPMVTLGLGGRLLAERYIC